MDTNDGKVVSLSRHIDAIQELHVTNNHVRTRLSDSGFWYGSCDTCEWSFGPFDLFTELDRKVKEHNELWHE